MNSALINADPWSFAQMIGYVATSIVVCAVSLKEEKKFTMMLAISMAVWSLHYSLLEAWTSAFTTLVIGFIQILWLTYPTVKSRVKNIMSFVFFMVFLTILLLTWHGSNSIWPWLIGVNTIYAFTYLKGIRMRVQILLTTTFWLINAFAVGSIGQMITSLITLTVSVWTIQRLVIEAKVRSVSSEPSVNMASQDDSTAFKPMS